MTIYKYNLYRQLSYGNFLPQSYLILAVDAPNYPRNIWTPFLVDKSNPLCHVGSLPLGLIQIPPN